MAIIYQFPTPDDLHLKVCVSNECNENSYRTDLDPKELLDCAVTYRLVNSIREAQDCLNEGLQKAADGSEIKGSLYREKGLLYKDLGSPEFAVVYLKKAYDIFFNLHDLENNATNCKEYIEEIIQSIEASQNSNQN